MERRRHTRFEVNVVVSFSQQDMTGKGYALNLSQEGCLVETDATVQKGAYLDLKLFFPNHDEPLHIESAAVRWIKGRVFGVEFLYMRTEEFERLNTFLATLTTPSPL